MARFIPVDHDTQFLFPPSVQEWLPEDHLARFIVDVIEQLDLSAIDESYAGRGSDAPSGDAGRAAALWVRHRHLLQPGLGTGEL